MLRLLLFCALYQFITCPCPDNFELARAGECRGFVSNQYLNHHEALDFTIAKCNEIGGKPVIIHNLNDQLYWRTRRQQTKGNLILGLGCNNSSNKWEWADGSPMDYLPQYVDDIYWYLDCTSGCSAYLWEDSHWHMFCDKNADNVNVFCSTQLPPLPTPSDHGCASFEDDKDDGVCYQIGAIAQNWQDAQRTCRSFGGDLASIHSQQENSFIRRLAVSKGAVNGVFLGATSAQDDGNFQWSDDSAFDYSNFKPGYPISGQGECLAMDTQDSAGRWTNTDCSSKKAVACERPQNAAPPTPTCSGGPYKEGDIIYSPGFPYDAKTPCDFILTVAYGKKVQVEVLLLEANTCCDWLYTYDNNDNWIGAYTGQIINRNLTLSPWNFMRVSWLPYDAVNVRGLMMTFRGV